MDGGGLTAAQLSTSLPDRGPAGAGQPASRQASGVGTQQRGEPSGERKINHRAQ